MRKKLSLRERLHFLPLKTGTALSPQAKAVQHPVRSRFFEMIFFLHDISTNPIAVKKAGKCKKVPQSCKISGGLEAITCFFASRYGYRGRDFSLPAQRHSRRPSQILLSAPLPGFSLVRSLFPLPAAVALQAHSLLRVARFRPFPQTKKEKRRRSVFFPFCLKATKRCVSEVKTNKSTPITLKINTKVLTSQYHCDII